MLYQKGDIVCRNLVAFNTRITNFLPYAGAIPFVACAGLKIMNIEQVPIFGAVHTILNSYGLLIASFIAGAHWGQHLKINKQISNYLALTSNSNVIALWILFLLLPNTLFFLPLLCSFTFTLIVDYKLYNNRIIRKSYFNLRCIVTTIVMTSLLAYGLVT